MTNYKRTRVLLHLLAGSAVILVSVLADHILSQPRVWGPTQSLALVTGFVIIAIGFLPMPMGIIYRVSNNLSLILLTVFVFTAVAEGFFRLIGYDFAVEERAWRKTPIYYRKPMAPTGDVFFKRTGPEQWTGQVLNTQVKLLGILPNPYSAEPVITVEYDRKGFRNPDHLSDWSIAVAGDSFTELGHLPYEQLFTSILAKILDISVSNLGTSQTSLLTHLSYLEDYGIAAGTKHAMIVFFEGNDLEELASEYNDLIRWRNTGQRDYREFRKQSSLVKALRQLPEQVGSMRIARDYIQSRTIGVYFKSSRGNVPVTIYDTPPDRSQLSNETMQQLDYFFSQYADFGKTRQITVWLAYMPSKRRVLHGRIEFSAGASDELKSWQPTDLPEVISELCDQYGIKFIDLTPSLVRETGLKKQLLYNSIFDSHLNSSGSMVVGQELARRFSGWNW